MKEWTPEAIRGWILKHLYELYMTDPLNYDEFSEDPNDDTAPGLLNVIREMEILEQVDYVKILGKTRDVLQARLTVNGRIAIEAARQEPDAPVRGPLGFDVEDKESSPLS